MSTQLTLLDLFAESSILEPQRTRQNVLKRLKPTNKILGEALGVDTRGSNYLIERVIYGLREASLRDVYPHLNLDEALAFAAGSREARKGSRFRDMAAGAELIEVFRSLHGKWFPILNRYKSLSGKNQDVWARLNPYEGSTLTDRLDRVGPTEEAKLREQLADEVCEWVFECNYDKRKRRIGHRLRHMDWQTVFPRTGKVKPNHIKAIGKELRSYPIELAL